MDNSNHSSERRWCETEVETLCRVLVQALSSLADIGAGCDAVVALFEAQPRDTPQRRSDLGNAFLRLDARPHWFGNGSHCQDWHALLRRTRNSPDHGPALLAAWSND